MAITEQIEIAQYGKQRAPKQGARARLLLSGYPRPIATRERRRNDMGPGSFTTITQEIPDSQPSALQVMCKNRQSKKKTR
ncbi:MAG: hypothetical protein NT067_02830 [Candidatus Diapherotrites archaeon]|nr:hypothetical protein [Candidatus Diapherotrites archaeon]